jgi:hypothetical protein
MGENCGRAAIADARDDAPAGCRVTSLGMQVVWLLILALPVACVAWTVTHEEVLREPREYCIERSRRARRWISRKFFYLFTCEYCFSHYVSAAVIVMTGYRLLLPDWRGFVIAWLAIVWIANQYMGLFNRLRLEIKDEKISIQAKEEQLGDQPSQLNGVKPDA